MLQWGHRLSAVETSRYTPIALSMFWLQWGHRLSAVETCPQAPGDDHAGLGIALSMFWLQWGHRLSAVETRERRRPGGYCEWRFNGATAFRQWKRFRGYQTSTESPSASMGPPPFGSGNASLLARPHVPRSSFNGATAFRQWRHPAFGLGLVHGLGLQWGHRLSAVETFVH